MGSNRIECDGHYLIIAPKPKAGSGYYHQLTERAYLVDSVIGFLKNYPDIKEHQITIYELRQVNESRPNIHIT